MLQQYLRVVVSKIMILSKSLFNTFWLATFLLKSKGIKQTFRLILSMTLIVELAINEQKKGPNWPIKKLKLPLTQRVRNIM